MSVFKFKECPRCGCRNAVRSDGSVSLDYCVSCDPKPDVVGYNVQVQQLRETRDGPPIHYRLRVLNPAGEIVFTHEPLGRDEAREMAQRMSEDIATFLGW